MNCLSPAAFNTWFTLFLSDAISNEGTIMTYAEVVKQLLTRYATDAVIAKADKKIRNFEQGPSVFGVSPKCYRSNFTVQRGLQPVDAASFFKA